MWYSYKELREGVCMNINDAIIKKNRGNLQRKGHKRLRSLVKRWKITISNL